MNNVLQYAFYGSLRRGMYNFNQYKEHLQYLSSEILSGYCLYALTDYPIAVQTGNEKQKIIVEIFKITNSNTERNIHQLEIEAGYYLKQIQIRDIPTGLYLFQESMHYPIVPNGDWVNYLA